jgi:hypothetical protein
MLLGFRPERAFSLPEIPASVSLPIGCVQAITASGRPALERCERQACGTPPAPGHAAPRARLAHSRTLVLADAFQLPLEALQCGRGLISPNRWPTVVAVAGVHQEADVLEFSSIRVRASAGQHSAASIRSSIVICSPPRCFLANGGRKMKRPNCDVLSLEGAGRSTR